MELRNEFAHVRVEVETAGNGPRLKIEDVKTGVSTYLDPLELESLAWMRHADLSPLLNPSQGRWRDPEETRFALMMQQLNPGHSA